MRWTSRGELTSPIRGSVAVIVSPSLADSRFVSLPALPAADDEANTISRLYASGVILRGGDADSLGVSAAMAGSEMMHFAGHAILDDAQPWRSVLALKPRGLTASAVAQMDLHRMRLAVLSACETMRSPDDATGGFAGLTDAFMAAGAGGVIGSLWRVGDEDAASLMKTFHRAFYRSGDAAQSLRGAQLALLQAHRPPGAWAAFRYAGR